MGFVGRLHADGETIKAGLVEEAEDCEGCLFRRHNKGLARRCVALSSGGRAITTKFPPGDCPLREGLLFKLVPAKEDSDE